MKHSRNVCKKVALLLSQYLEGELDFSSCKKVIEHMKDCPACVAFLRSLRKTVELTRDAASAPTEIPPLSEDVRRKLKESYESFRAKSAGRSR